MKIGIFGRTKADDEKLVEKAKEIGKFLAIRKHTVVTGGTEGYPHVVALEAIKYGGDTISYAVGLSMSDHKKFHNIVLTDYTEVIFQKKYFIKQLHPIDNYLRSLDMCLSVDAAIIIGGRVGTMYEITIMSGMGKDIFVLKNSGGITNKTIKKFIKEGHKEKSKIFYFKNIKELTDLL